MKYFKECNTIDEVKALYKKLAKENHPDLGGDTVIMQTINTEYAFACARLAKGAGLTDEEADEEIKLSELYRAAIEQIIHLPGIVIELVGNWIWVTGHTRPVKEELKAAHFFFASKKCAWYFRAEQYKTRRSNKSLEEIRRKYGSQQVNTKSKEKVLED